MPTVLYDQSKRIPWLDRHDHALLQLCHQSVKRMPAGTALADVPGGCLILQAGWAAKYVLLPDGRRQVLDIVVPGDWCWRGEAAGYSLISLTPVEVLGLGLKELLDARSKSASIRAFLAFLAHSWHLMRIQRLVTLGQRNSLERVSHLLWEITKRLDFIAYAEGHRIPVTRQICADALGMTERHVSRVLLQLRDQGHLLLERGWVRVLDQEAIGRIAGGESFFLDEAADYRASRTAGEPICCLY